MLSTATPIRHFKLWASAALLTLAMSATPTDAEAQFFIKKPLPQHVAAGQEAKEFKEDDVVTIKTTLGDIVLLLSDRTPVHKANFLKLVKDGTYTGTTFHRIIQGFMIQGGDVNSKDADPSNDGAGNVGYTIPAEFDDSLTHVMGAVAAARMGDQVNPTKASSGCQFYIVDNPNGAHFLNRNYTVFGKVIKGIEVVQQIATQPKGPNDRPLTNIVMTVEVKTMRRSRIEDEFKIKYN
jgi:cyclophilin family peptidyl-prolyl cis-trans isomerase